MNLNNQLNISKINNDRINYELKQHERNIAKTNELNQKYEYGYKNNLKLLSNQDQDKIKKIRNSILKLTSFNKKNNKYLDFNY